MNFGNYLVGGGVGPWIYLLEVSCLECSAHMLRFFSVRDVSDGPDVLPSNEVISQPYDLISFG